MTTAVSAGVAYVTATPSGQASQTLRVYNNATANVTHAANSSGSTKYDWIYIKIDAANAAAPNTAGDNVATLVASRSSSASSDDGTPPTYGYPIAVVTVANGASSITNGNIADSRDVTGATPADDSVTYAKVAAGIPVQMVSQNFTSVATGTTTLPTDDTIPQNTEGTEFMTLAITPKSATNILVIEVTFFGGISAANDRLQCALFQDSTANALAGAGNFLETANTETTVTFRHRMVAGTTSATTFKVRAGSNGAATTTFNGTAATRRFGAITKSSMVITEYKAS
jgi:hypothetical protein